MFLITVKPEQVLLLTQELEFLLGKGPSSMFPSQWEVQNFAAGKLVIGHFWYQKKKREDRGAASYSWSLSLELYSADTFEMLTLKFIMSQFNLRIGLSWCTKGRIFFPFLPSHRKFLRLTFGGKLTVIGFFRSTFSKCKDSALAPLWLHHTLNYIDDWLI